MSSYDALAALAVIISVNVIRAIGLLTKRIATVILPSWLAAPLAGFMTYFSDMETNQGEIKWLKAHPPGPGYVWSDKDKTWLPNPKTTPGTATPGTATPSGTATPGELPQEVYNRISHSEGTMRKGQINYNAVYGNGKYSLPSQPISTMTLDQVLAFGNQMRQSELAQGWRRPTTTAVGGFQIEDNNIREYAKAHSLGLSTTILTPDLQRKMAAWLKARQTFIEAWPSFKTHPRDLAAAQKAMSAAANKPNITLPTITVTPSTSQIPAYQHGGIVSITHPGESVLPRDLTNFLMASARIAAPTLSGIPSGRMPVGGHVDNRISIGALHVHTAATNAGDIARQLPSLIQQELTKRVTTRVMSANTAFE